MYNSFYGQTFLKVQKIMYNYLKPTPLSITKILRMTGKIASLSLIIMQYERSLYICMFVFHWCLFNINIRKIISWINRYIITTAATAAKRAVALATVECKHYNLFNILSFCVLVLWQLHVVKDKHFFLRSSKWEEK